MPAPAEPLPLAAERVGDTPRRVAPDLFEFYNKRAHDLRAKAIRSLGSALAMETKGEAIMPDRHPRPDAGYLRDLAARDPIGLHLSVRNWRNAHIRALGSALLLFVWRYIKQQFEAWRHLGRRRRGILSPHVSLASAGMQKDRQQMDPQTPSLALAKERTAQETKPTFAMRLAKVFKRAKKAPIGAYPITSADKALIANLMAMR